jgi:hypothetical protein
MTQPYAVRIKPETRRALEAAALGKQTKPRTLAAQLIADGLARAGYLPKPPKAAQPAAQ